MDAIKSSELLGIPQEIALALSQESFGDYTKKLGRFLRHVSHPDRGGESAVFCDVGEHISVGEEHSSLEVMEGGVAGDSLWQELRRIGVWGEIGIKERLETADKILAFLRDSGSVVDQANVFSMRDFELSVVDTLYRSSIDPGNSGTDRDAAWREMMSRAQEKTKLSAKGGDGPTEIHEAANVVLDEMAQYKLIVDADGGLIRVDWHGVERLKDKFLIGCLPTIWFMDLVTPNDYRQEAAYRIPLTVSEHSASLGIEIKSENQDARSQFLGMRKDALAGIEKGKMDLSNFWRIGSCLTPKPIRLGYLVSLNLPKDLSPYIALEGELDSWKPLRASSRTKYLSALKEGK